MVIVLRVVRFTQPRVGEQVALFAETHSPSSACGWVIARRPPCKRRSIWEGTGSGYLDYERKGRNLLPAVFGWPAKADIFPRVLTKAKSLFAFRPDQLSELVPEQ